MSRNYLNLKYWAQTIQILVTGNVTWLAMNDEDEDEHEKLDWHMRWVIVGPKPYTWWWVRKWGIREDGNAYNPITGKQYTYSMDESSFMKWLEEGDIELPNGG